MIIEASSTVQSAIRRLVGMDDAPNPVELLKVQHRDIEALFKEMEAATEEEAYMRKEDLFTLLAGKIVQHMTLEEKYFYPRFKTIDDVLACEAYEEHDAAKQLIKKIQKLAGKGTSFDGSFKFLKELMDHHFKEEENDLFPLWETEESADNLASVGLQMRDFLEAGSKVKKHTRKRTRKVRSN